MRPARKKGSGQDGNRYRLSMKTWRDLGSQNDGYRNGFYLTALIDTAMQQGTERCLMPGSILETHDRETAPQSPFSLWAVVIGGVVLLVGLFLTVVLPIVI